MNESARQDAMRRIAARNHLLEGSELSMKARAEREANSNHGLHSHNGEPHDDAEIQGQRRDSLHVAFTSHNRQSESTALGEILELRFNKSVVCLWRQRQEEEEIAEEPDS